MNTAQVESILSKYGYGLGLIDDRIMAMIDQGGLRPGDPNILRQCADSLFLGADEGKKGEPVVHMRDFNYDHEVEAPLPFGHLPERSFYGDFDLLPWMGIAGRDNERGSVEECDAMADLFGEEGDPISEGCVQLCDSNSTATFEPVVKVASSDFKEVNDAKRLYENRFQDYVSGNVLVLGSGADPLCTTFDFSKAHVTYVDSSSSNILELKKRADSFKGRLPRYKTLVADVWDVYPDLQKWKYNLIIMNHSIHHIVEGCVQDQLVKLRSIVDLLTHSGALIGVGPSLSGLISTPKTHDTRNRAGLLGLFATKKGIVYAQSQIGNHHFTEPVFFSSLLYKIEEERGGVAQIFHLSNFVHMANDKDTIRMYESFSYIPAKERPKGVKVSVAVAMRASTYDPMDAVKVTIKGRKGQRLPIATAKTVDRDVEVADGLDMTRGALIGAQHLPRLLYQGPYLISEKLDGELGKLEWNPEGGYCSLDWADKCITIAHKSKSPAWSAAVEVMTYGNEIEVYWLETTRRRGKLGSGWISGIRSWLPEWLYFKDYETVTVENFLSKVLKSKEGIVLLNPHDRVNNWKPQQMFYKKELSVDFALNNQIYEMTRNQCTQRYNHSANGLLRVFEAPFLLNSQVIIAALRMRKEPRAMSTIDSQDARLLLSDIFSFPNAADTTMMSRERNTALVQLWRGGWGFQADVGWGGLASNVVPMARHEDWGIFGALYERACAGEYDKDEIFGRSIAPNVPDPVPIDEEDFDRLCDDLDDI